MLHADVSILAYGASSPYATPRKQIPFRSYTSPSCQRIVVELRAVRRPKQSKPLVRSQSALSLVRQREAKRKFILALCSASSPAVATLQSPALARQQLREGLARAYFPTIDQDIASEYSQMLSRAVLTATYGLAKEAAVDSLCLLQLGYSAKDKDLINEGRVRYNAAVAKLRFELGKVGAIHDDGVLGTTYILGCCDFYQAVPYRQTSFTHLYGMRTLLELRGPDDSYSPFAKLVVNNMRALLAVYGMSERKAVPFHCAKWRDRIPMPPDAQGKLSRLVAGVPGLMERTDVCLRRTPVNPSELDDVLLQLSVHESNLQEWYLAWLRSFEESPYRLVSIRKFPHFQRHGPSTSQVFPMVLEFPSFAKASCLTAYWIGLLHLKQQLLDLLALKCSGELNERKKRCCGLTVLSVHFA